MRISDWSSDVCSSDLEQGLAVEVIAPADPSDPPKMVAAGKADLAVSYQPQLHFQVHEGLPLRRVGTLVATPLNCLLVPRDGPVKSLADLKGRDRKSTRLNSSH